MDQTYTPASRLTLDGEHALGEICRRYGVGNATGLALLDALSRTNGTMAQFNLSELGGSGQWMSGGMVMVGDMFNQGLKARVDSLCNDLAALLSASPFRPAPVPSGGDPWGGGAQGGTAGQWWPAALGTPNWQGSQNNLRYACFAAANRLAIDIHGTVSVYDTSGFTLTGVSQQQSSGYGGYGGYEGYEASLTLTGPGGIVTLDRLRRVDGGDVPPPARSGAGPVGPVPAAAVRPDRTRAVPEPLSSQPVLDDRLSGTRWRYAPKAGAAFVPVTLDAEGIVSGTGNDAIRYWAVEEAVLWLYGADGRATARFDRILQEPDGVRIFGASPPESGDPVVLRAEPPRPAAAPVSPAGSGPTVLEVRLEPCNHNWAFGPKAEGPIATLRPLPDGTLSGSPRPSESLWRLEDGVLVFLHKSGRPTLRFTTMVIREGHWTLSGPALANEHILYELSQLSP